MKYESGGAFKAALEAKIRRIAGRDKDRVTRLRKLIAADRLIARLLVVESNGWAVKGGMALDLRYGNRARMTKDLDLVRTSDSEPGFEVLLAAADIDLNDYFVFTIGKATTFNDEGNAATRFQARVELNGTLFERLVVDIGIVDSLPDPPDRLTGIEFLNFAELGSKEIPAIPLPLHVAEKLHAYTRLYSGGRQSSRVKDLVDIVLISREGSLRAVELQTALKQTFTARQTHQMPLHFPSPPDEWSVPYRDQARKIGLDPDINNAYFRAVRFLDPILTGDISEDALWNPEGYWS